MRVRRKISSNFLRTDVTNTMWGLAFLTHHDVEGTSFNVGGSTNGWTQLIEANYWRTSTREPGMIRHDTRNSSISRLASSVYISLSWNSTAWLQQLIYCCKLRLIFRSPSLWFVRLPTSYSSASAGYTTCWPHYLDLWPFDQGWKKSWFFSKKSKTSI